MFSSTAEYALRAAAFLAERPDGLTSSQTIAEATKVPRGYLSKVLNDLVNAGITSSAPSAAWSTTTTKPAPPSRASAASPATTHPRKAPATPTAPVLSTLECDLHIHIHNENNILFPAGTRAEERLDAGGQRPASPPQVRDKSRDRAAPLRFTVA